MQLKPDGKGVRRRLIAASCALLGASVARGEEPPSVAADAGQGDVLVDSALAYYHENNGRVTAIEPAVTLRREDGDGGVSTVNLTFDSLSGSSPNGALPSTKVQTFASPSGTSLSAVAQTYTTASGQSASSSAPIYTISPGQLPVDPNYKDQRLAIGGSYQWPLSRLLRMNLGGSLSYEHDFVSLSGNATIARDFNEKNTTLSFGVNGESDALHPIGGAPVPASDYALFEKRGGASKHGVGAQLGITQVINRQWVSEFNLTADRFRGYLNDPYKIVSVIDSGGNTTGYLYEKRPETRTRKSAYLDNRYAWDRASLGLSARYMADDWGIKSDTLQLHLRWWNTPHDRYLEPNFRWYRQTAADFYTPWILSAANAAVSNASADSRLGAFHAFTYGLKYSIKSQAAAGTEFSVRLEYYRQQADNRLAGPGVLQGLDLYPELKALLLQVGYRFSY